MSVNPSAFGPKPQFLLANGTPAVGNLLYFYVGGSVNSKQSTFTDSTGLVANTNPIVLNTLGMPTTQIWWTAGQTYKVVYAPSNDTDPPTSPIFTVDGLLGNNDTTNASSEWTAGPAPTFVSATSFTLVGDQTSIFTPGRRIKTTNTGGTVYSTILTSAFGIVTTITLANDSSTIDSGLSAVSYGLISSANTSEPLLIDTYPIRSGSVDKTKKVRFEVDGLTTATQRVLTVADQDMTLGPIPRSHLAGLTMSTAGASATMSVAAGQATDSTSAAVMNLASAISKTTSAWAVGSGNGGKLSAAALAATTYHFYEIMRLDTGVVDVGFDTSATSPTLPTNYTIFRRIGSAKNDGTNWVAFIQDGDLFQWLAPVTGDISSNNPGTSAVTRTLTIPTGLNVEAIVTATLTIAEINTAMGWLLTDLATTDTAPSQTFTSGGTFNGSPNPNQSAAGQLRIRTNTSAQIRSRLSASDGNITLVINTLGWIDTRGRNA